jgi:hypothetical protein
MFANNILKNKFSIIQSEEIKDLYVILTSKESIVIQNFIFLFVSYQIFALFAFSYYLMNAIIFILVYMAFKFSSKIKSHKKKSIEPYFEKSKQKSQMIEQFSLEASKQGSQNNQNKTKRRLI